MTPIQSPDQMTATTRLPGAALTDRILAFAFDLCLWIPALLLVLRPISREYQYQQLVAPGSTEAYLYFAILVGVSIFLLILMETVMIAVWSTTPGKRLFRLSVRRYSDQGKLSWGQAFLRSCVQLAEFLFFALPCLEIFSHPERRPWHDRLSESVVLSEGSRRSEIPHALEQRFFRNLYWAGALSFALFSGQLLWKTYNQLSVGAFKRHDLQKSGYLCAEVERFPAPDLLSPDETRLDFALALFNAGKVGRECLEAEADFAFWTQNTDLRPWASLIRGVLEQDQGIEAKREKWTRYLQAACPRNSEEGEGSQNVTPSQVFRCRLVADYWPDRPASSLSPAEDLGRQIQSRSWTEKIRALHRQVEQGQFKKLDRSLRTETWPDELRSSMQDLALKSLVVQSRQAEFQSARDIVMQGWSADTREKNEAWVCLAETMRSCGREMSSACRELGGRKKGDLAMAKETVLALGFDLWCGNKRETGVENHLRDLRKSDPLLSWISDGERVSGRATRQQQFDVLIGKLREMPMSHWARISLLWWTSRLIDSEKQFEQLALEFQRSPRRDPSWWLAFRALEERLPADLLNLTRRGLSSVRDAEDAE